MHGTTEKLLDEIHQPPDDVLFWMTQVILQHSEGAEAVYGTNPLLSPIKTIFGFLAQNNYLGPLEKMYVGFPAS